MSTTTPNIGLTKPVPGDTADRNLWGGTLNDNADTIDAIFKSDGTGTGVGLKAAASQVWNAIAGTLKAAAARLLIVDATDNTKVVKLDVSGVATGTTRTLTVQNANGTIALSADVTAAQSAAISTSEAYTDTKARRILQVAQSNTGTSATGTTTVPSDNTIPQNTEGDQYMSLAFTPLSASSTIFIEVTGYFSTSATAGNAIMSLFRDSGANALATGVQYMATTGAVVCVGLECKLASPGTSATTFKVRCGSNTAGTTTFNGSAGAQLYGGVFVSRIKITEYI